MNVKEYISSGIIESYVLGLLSPEERMEFEDLCIEYPELQNARNEFEEAFEKQAFENAIDPPVGLKNKIFEQLQSVKGRAPGVIKIKPAERNWLKYAIAACLLLLAGSFYWNISLYNRNRKLQEDVNNSVTTIKGMEEDIRVIKDRPQVKMASMKGLGIAPEAYATVYWDTASKDVYLLVNNLPQPPTDKQYQLWALLNGKPIDGGMIDNNYFLQQNKLLIRMKDAQGAQAFAITLEKKGGNPTPQGVMYVKGEL